jgi:hypothetical protein
MVLLSRLAGAAGAASVAACVAALVRRGDPVELAGAALQDLAAGFRGKLAMVLVAVQPQGDGGLESLAAGLLAAFPDPEEDFPHLFGVGGFGADAVPTRTAHPAAFQLFDFALLTHDPGKCMFSGAIRCWIFLIFWRDSWHDGC